MVTLVAHFHVRDYDAWKVVFDRHEALRRRHGGLEHRIYRDIHDTDRVIVHNDFPSEEAAQGFREDPELREAMASSGIEGDAGFSLIVRAERKVYEEAATA